MHFLAYLLRRPFRDAGPTSLGTLPFISVTVWVPMYARAYVYVCYVGMRTFLYVIDAGRRLVGFIFVSLNYDLELRLKIDRFIRMCLM